MFSERRQIRMPSKIKTREYAKPKGYPTWTLQTPTRAGFFLSHFLVPSSLGTKKDFVLYSRKSRGASTGATLLMVVNLPVKCAN